MGVHGRSLGAETGDYARDLWLNFLRTTFWVQVSFSSCCQLLQLCGTFQLTQPSFPGCSQNFSWALSTRFLWGMLNGNLGVAKTFISEVRNSTHHVLRALSFVGWYGCRDHMIFGCMQVCDNSNLAKGFAVVGASGGIGRLIVGPDCMNWPTCTL